jgi:SAGA-associated factor 11
MDVFGNMVPAVPIDPLPCPICERTVASGSFAQHLSKCMGRGRQASRQANRRLQETLHDL